MAEINFLPVCSACRAILDDHEINFVGMNLKIANTMMTAPDTTIQPMRCPYCGAYFDRITMPAELPVLPSRSFTGV